MIEELEERARDWSNQQRVVVTGGPPWKFIGQEAQAVVDKQLIQAYIAGACAERGVVVEFIQTHLGWSPRLLASVILHEEHWDPKALRESERKEAHRQALEAFGDD